MQIPVNDEDSVLQDVQDTNFLCSAHYAQLCVYLNVYDLSTYTLYFTRLYIVGTTNTVVRALTLSLPLFGIRAVLCASCIRMYDGVICV